MIYFTLRPTLALEKCFLHYFFTPTAVSRCAIISLSPCFKIQFFNPSRDFLSIELCIMFIPHDWGRNLVSIFPPASVPLVIWFRIYILLKKTARGEGDDVLISLPFTVVMIGKKFRFVARPCCRELNSQISRNEATSEKRFIIISAALSLELEDLSSAWNQIPSQNKKQQRSGRKRKILSVATRLLCRLFLLSLACRYLSLTWFLCSAEMNASFSSSRRQIR